MEIGLALLTLVICYVHGYPTGAPEQACGTLLPAHGFEPQSTPCPYHINTVTNHTRHDVKVTVTTDSGYPAYRGILLQVRRQDVDSTQDDVIVGSWELDDDVNFQTISCSNLPNSSVTHTNERMKPSSAIFTWTPWNDQNEIIYIAVTIVESQDKFWVGNGRNRPGGLIGACISSPCGEGTCFLRGDDSSKYICKCPGDVEGSQCPPLSTDNATTEGTTGTSPATTINEKFNGGMPTETLVAIVAPSALVLLIVIIGLVCYCNWRIKKTRENEHQTGSHGNSALPRLSQKSYVRDDEAPYVNTSNTYAETMPSSTGSEERRPQESTVNVHLPEPQHNSHHANVIEKLSTKYENDQVVRGLHGTHQKRQNYINHGIYQDRHDQEDDSSRSYVNSPQHSHGIGEYRSPVGEDRHKEDDSSGSHVKHSDSIEEPRSPVGDLIQRFSSVSSKYVNDQVGKSLSRPSTQKKRKTYINQVTNQDLHEDGDNSRRSHVNSPQHSDSIEEPRSSVGDLIHSFSPVSSEYVNDQVGKSLAGPSSQKKRQTYINQVTNQDHHEEKSVPSHSYVNSPPSRNDTQNNDEHIYDPVCIN